MAISQIECLPSYGTLLSRFLSENNSITLVLLNILLSPDDVAGFLCLFTVFDNVIEHLLLYLTG